MDAKVRQVTVACPLCGEELNIDLADWQVAGKWRAALAHRDRWADASSAFRTLHSIEETACHVSLTEDETRLILEFLCLKVCGCRAVTCVSCLDDWRSEL